MMTIVTHVHLKEGVGRAWDAAMRTRLSAAKKRPGWVGGQLLRQSMSGPWCGGSMPTGRRCSSHALSSIQSSARRSC